MNGKHDEYITINVNQKCTVTLWPRGIEAYEKYQKSWNIDATGQLQDGDTLTAPLWEIMEIFGPSMDQGSPSPFHTNIKIHPIMPLHLTQEL